MATIADNRFEFDGVRQVIGRIERRLLLSLTVLSTIILLILGTMFGQPVLQYVAGPEHTFSAALAGAGCGAHLEWETDATRLDRGSTVRFENDTTYWRIPVVIERQRADGTYSVVASSPGLNAGETWSYTFWRSGEYRIASEQEFQRIAGLEMTLRVS